MSLPFIHRKGMFPSVTLEKILDGIEVKYDTFIAVQSGREVVCKEPRATAWFSDSGNSFIYSGKVMEPVELTPTLKAIRDDLETILGVHYCSVLVNYYPHGKSGIRYHSDPLFDPANPTKQIWIDNAAVISVGDPRTFIVREKEDSPERKYYRFRVESGDVFQMTEGCQAAYQHTVQVEKHEEDVGPRVSLVFKKHI